MKTNIITKKDLTRVNVRWLFCSQICWNYEKMQAQGYLYSMLPVLQKFYKGEELKEMMRYHNQFYNTSPHLGPLILGADIAMEEKEGYQAKDAVAGIKAGLMGSFGGIGDSLFILITTIFGAIAAYMAVQGNIIGVLIWLLVNIVQIIIRLLFIYPAYKNGTNLFVGMSKQLTALTDAATILGITMIGALIPTVVKTNVLYTFKTGEVVVSLQDVLNQIMPALLPAIIVGIIYSLFGNKKVRSTIVILGVIACSIIAYALNILG